VILAAKHLELETCVLNVSSVILERLLSDGAASIEDILVLVERKLGHDARFNVVPALTFLYMRRTIRYASEIDAIIFEPRPKGAE
jgi:hypothetical protein